MTPASPAPDPTTPPGDKTERLMNLVLALKAARRPVTKATLRRTIPDYERARSDEAFERMFERDKDDLRQLGIPVRATAVDVLFDDEVGYRIDADDTTLPEISFEPDELLALGLAAQAWSGASMGGSAAGALRKLRLVGVEVDDDVSADVRPVLRPREPAFDEVNAAWLARQAIAFRYRSADGRVGERRVQPWALTLVRGRYYVTGWDLDRKAERAFRLGRIEGNVVRRGKAGAYEIPADHVPRVLIGDHDSGPTGVAVIRLAPEAGQRLRATAESVTALPDGWSEVRVPYVPSTTLREVLGLGSGAVAVSPPGLVDAAVRRLQGVAQSNAAPEGHRHD